MNAVDRRVNFKRHLLWIAAVTLLVSARAQAADTPEIPRSLPDGYIVLPFANDSGVNGLEWMRVGLPAALAEKLEAHPGLRPLHGDVIVPAGAPPATIDATTVATVAKAQGAKFVWTGSFTRPNWKLEFTLRLWQVDGDKAEATLVGEKKEHGDFSDCFEMLDDAALDLLGKAGRPVPAKVVERVSRAPTGDFYAFTLYGRGLMALHGLGASSELGVAEKNLARSVFIDPKFAEAHRLLAVVYERAGKTGKARGQLAFALDLRPDYYAPLALLVKSAYAAKEREEAMTLAERALALRPWDLDVRYMLAEMRWDEGDADGAYTELSRLVAFKSDHLPARRILVLIHSAKGNSSELAAELEKIIALDPADEAAKLDLGAAYHALGKDESAIAIYDAIVQKNPKHMQALKFLGDLYRSRGDLKTAISYYEKALATNKQDPRPYFLLGAAYLTAGQTKDALRIYKQAQKFTRYLGETYSNLGAIYYQQGNNDEALWYLSQAVKKRPSNPRVHYNYGLALSKAHKRELAHAEFSDAVQLEPGDAEFRYALGVSLLRLGRIEEAEKSFQEAATIDPTHDDARHNLRLIEELRRRAKEGEIQVE